jgi:hypothetical protein
MLAMLLLAASVALFVAAPLTEIFTTPGRSKQEVEAARLEHDRGLALAALRELEFDHAMGKIADGEFATMRTRLEVRALAAMSALERLRAPAEPVAQARTASGR